MRNISFGRPRQRSMNGGVDAAQRKPEKAWDPGSFAVELLWERLCSDIATDSVFFRPAKHAHVSRRGFLPKHISRFGLTLAFAAAVAVGTLASPSRAAAQDPAEEPVQIEASPKGLIGLGFIGAELGLTIPALAGLDETWSLIIFPVVGAAGGAIAGHYAIDNRGNEKAAVATLMIGLALVVPSIVITVAATAYDPEDDFEEEDAGGGDEAAEAESEPEAEPEAEIDRRRRLATRGGTGMVRVHEGGVSLAPPGLTVGQVYTAQELARYGGEQATEVHLSLFSGAF